MDRIKQYMRVLDYMRTHGGITQNEATKYIGCSDVAGAVYKLKKHGYTITSVWIKGANRYGEQTRFKRYSIAEQEAE